MSLLATIPSILNFSLFVDIYILYLLFRMVDFVGNLFQFSQFQKHNVTNHGFLPSTYLFAKKFRSMYGGYVCILPYRADRFRMTL